MTVDQRPVILQAEGVTKRFDRLVAVNNVNYVLRENEVAGLIGSNGAGKTTFFNLLTGYFAPDEGTISYKGHEINRKTPQERVALGMVRTFQITATFDNLDVLDNLVLAYFRAHRPSTLSHLIFNRGKRMRKNEQILAALEAFDLQDVAQRLVQHLSLGEKRRLEIAMSILAQPQVLLLDEPLAGLAESEIAGVMAVLRKCAATQTILIVEHKISHVEDFLERVTVMHEGQVIADGSYEECMRDPAVRKSYWQIDVETQAMES